MASEISSWNLNVLAAVGLGGLAALAYLVSRARLRRGDFTLVDTLILVATMAIVTAAGIPLFNYAADRAKASSLAQLLHTMRVQIELYKVDHDGEVPLLFEGTFPQLSQATDRDGTPGPAGKQHPFGPYLPHGIPANPYSGISYVAPTDSFPPKSAKGIGGWLYHQETGQLAPDLKDCLEK